jgi:hypothetical protein
MFELLIRILCDIQPAAATNGTFLFGQTEDNDTSVLTKAQQLLETKQTALILFMHTPPANGYPGFEAWESQLIKAGVARKQIAGVPLLQAPVLHTLVEAQSLMTYARQQNFESIYVTAAPFHQPRAFMTAVRLLYVSTLSLKFTARPAAHFPGCSRLYITGQNQRLPYSINCRGTGNDREVPEARRPGISGTGTGLSEQRDR